jgi:DNA polymerase alpha subunit A
MMTRATTTTCPREARLVIDQHSTKPLSKLLTWTHTAKRKREEDAQQKEKINKGISKYFNANPVVAAPKVKQATTAEDAAFMADLLGEVNASAPSYRSSLKPVKSESRRKTRVLSPPVERMTHVPNYQPRDQLDDNSPLPTTTAAEVDDDTYFPMDEGLFPQHDDNDVPMSDPLPSSPVAKAAQRKESNVKAEDDEDEDMLEVAQVTNQSSRSTAAINMRGNRPILLLHDKLLNQLTLQP